MKKNKILKEACVLLITAVMISSMVATADTATNVTPEDVDCKEVWLGYESDNPSPLTADVWVGFDDGGAEYGIGTSSPPIWFAIHMDNVELAPYDGWELEEIRWYEIYFSPDAYPTHDVYYIIAEGNATAPITEIINESETTTNVSDWKNYNFTTTYTIDASTDLWIIIWVSDVGPYPDDCPAGYDANPNSYVAGKSAMSDNGADPYPTFSDFGLQLPGAWLINIKVVDAGPSIDVEKEVYVPGSFPGNCHICLEDSWGDGWNGGVVDVYVNEVLLYDDLTLTSGSGPECHPIPTMVGDNITTDYTPGSYAYENYYEIMDWDGNILGSAWGDDPDPDLTVFAPFTTPPGTWVDADTPEEAVDFEICTIVEFRITIHNDGDAPIYDIWLTDEFDDSLEFVNASPSPTYVEPGILQWIPLEPYELYPCESIIITVWFHVVGPHCSIDENYAFADALCDIEPYYVSDEDSAWVHCIDPYRIDVEKMVWASGAGEYQICLYDTFGDGWDWTYGGPNYVDLFVNDDLVGTYTLEDGYGPECHSFAVEDGDEITTDYYYNGYYPEENEYWVLDGEGNIVRHEGAGYTIPGDILSGELYAYAGQWVDADTEGEAVDFDICTIAPFKITIHNDGMNELFDIWAYDEFDDSMQFVNATPYPDYVGSGILEWYYLGDLMPGETITIMVWMHVVGPDCSVDENKASADDADGYTYDEDSAWIHCVEPDTEPPVTTIDIVGTAGDNNWFVSDVTITLTATDDDSGVKETWYRIDGGDWTEYTGPFTYGEDGTHTIEVYSIDNEGNVEDPPVEEDFKIDQTVPTIVLTWDEDNMALIADVDDETSGVAKVEFYVNDELLGEVTEAPYEWEYPEASSGDIAKAIVYDNAGNSAESESIESFSNNMQSQSSPVQKVLRQRNL